MRDPTAHNRINEAFDEADMLLGLAAKVGELRSGVEEDQHRWERLNARYWISHHAPKDLRPFLLKMLDGRGGPSARKRRSTNSLRDKWIVGVVQRMMDRGFSPTRNRAAQDKASGELACSIVAKTLAHHHGLKLSEAAIEAVWARHRDDPHYNLMVRSTLDSGESITLHTHAGVRNK